MHTSDFLKLYRNTAIDYFLYYRKLKRTYYLGKFRKKTFFQNAFLLDYGLHLLSVLKINIDT